LSRLYSQFSASLQLQQPQKLPSPCSYGSGGDVARKSRLYHAIYSDINKGHFPTPDFPWQATGDRLFGRASLDIAKSLKCSKASVNRILKRHRETGTTSPAKRTGRKPLLNSPARACLKALITNDGNRRLCTAQVTTFWAARSGNGVSSRTIRRNLKKVKLKSCIPRRKPAMSEANRLKRLEWARTHEHWTVNDWKKVVFSDESTFAP